MEKRLLNIVFRLGSGSGITCVRCGVTADQADSEGNTVGKCSQCSLTMCGDCFEVHAEEVRL